MNQLPTKDWQQIVNMFTKQNIPLFDDEEQSPCLVPEHGDAPGRAAICSIPKAGTYFFAALLEALGYVSCGVHVADGCFVDCRFAPPETVRRHPKRLTFPLPSSFVLPLVRPGQFVVGHLPCTAQYPSRLRTFRVLFVYRNLRDSLVSYMRYVTKNWVEACPANAWAQQADGPEKMDRFLVEHAYYLPMCATMMKWHHRPEVFSCCFEDFMGDRGRAVQLQSLAALVRFTGAAPCRDPDSVLARVMGQQTLTSSGSRTDARACWSERVERYFREHGGVEMNRQLGYAES
jgi:hypothetical protein